MNRRIFGMIIVTLLLGVNFPARAQQQPKKIPRIGYVSGTGSTSNPEPYVEALRQELHNLGYTEKKDFAIEFRGVAGKVETVPSIVADLIRLKVDILVLPTISALRCSAGQDCKPNQ